MKNISIGTICGLLVLAVSASAEASIKISLNQTNLVDGSTQVSFQSGAVDPSGGNSGFLGHIYDSGGTLLESWETFCVEAFGHAEFVHLDNRKYTMESTTSTNATNTNNFITDAAKWVYYQFGRGGLTGWTANDGEEVQQAIWSLVEGAGIADNFLTTADGKALQWRNDALAAVQTVQGLAEASRIRIINPVTLNSDGSVRRYQQSMLYEVPEASTIVVWSMLSMLGLSAHRRRNS